MILKPNTYKTLPWRNGQGVTREIFLAQGQQAVDFDWRLSIASIKKPGPFSSFPQHIRTLIPLNKEGIILQHGNSPSFHLPHLCPYEFDGALDTQSLGSKRNRACLDFNLMVRRSWGKASLSVLSGPKTLSLSATAASAIFMVKGRALVSEWQAPEEIGVHSTFVSFAREKRGPVSLTLKHFSVAFLMEMKALL